MANYKIIILALAFAAWATNVGTIRNPVSGAAHGAKVTSDSGLHVTLADGNNTHDLDDATGAVVTTNHEHHKIHDGCAFTAHFENLCTNTGEQSVIAFNTPNTTKWIHVIATAASTSIARFSIVENPSIDVDEGTDLVVYNKDRNSATTSGVLTIETTPEAGKATSFNEAQAADANITETTQLGSIVVGAAGAGVTAGVGGNATHQFEWICDQNQQYGFIVESLDNGDNYHTVELNWYEHTSEN